MGQKRWWRNTAAALLLGIVPAFGTISSTAAETNTSHAQAAVVSQQIGGRPGDNEPSYDQGYKDGFGDAQKECKRGEGAPGSVLREHSELAGYGDGYEAGLEAGFQFCENKPRLRFQMGRNDGLRDGKLECEMKKPISTLVHPFSGSRDYDIGYKQGLFAGYNRAGCA
ncbi:MAG TPA: hypothetical protein VFN35_35895 [Ktedonobacteraceae bacterium]|nr:hypothetical protein [Ktedonobacteraceae bacterium]